MDIQSSFLSCFLTSMTYRRVKNSLAIIHTICIFQSNRTFVFVGSIKIVLSFNSYIFGDITVKADNKRGILKKTLY